MNYLKSQLNSEQQNQNWLMLSVRQTFLTQFESTNDQSLKKLLAGATGVKTVLNGSEVVRGPLEQTPPPALYAYRYLLTDFNLEVLPVEIGKRWEELQLGLVLDKRWLLSDPTYQWLNYQQQLHPNMKLAKKDGRWFDEGTNQSLLLIEFSGNKIELTALDDSLQQWLGTDNYVLSGYKWVATKAEAEIKQSVTLVSVLASLMVVIALLLAFRSSKLLFYSSLPLLAAVVVGMLATITVFGQIQVITLALGAILLGVAIDYPIHVLSAYQSRQEAVYGKIWSTVKLGATTSILGFIALFWVDVNGIKQVGVFAGSGLLAALLVTASLRPYFATYFELLACPQTSEGLQANSQDQLMKMDSRALLIFLLATTLGGSVFILKPAKWQDDIASLSPVSQSLITADQELRSLFKANEVGKKILVSSSSMEVLLQTEELLFPILENLKKQKQITGYHMLAQSLPSQAKQQQRQAILPDNESIEGWINQAIEQTRFKTTHFKAFADELAESKQLPLLDYEKYIFLTSNQVSQGSRGWFKDQNRYIGVIELSGVESDSAVINALKAFSQDDITYFNQRKLVADQIQQTRHAIFTILIIISFLLVMIIWSKYRRLAAVLNITLPIIAAFCLLYSSLALLGVSLNIFHLMSFMLVAAIGIDYSLLFFEASTQDRGFDEWKRSVRIAFLTTIGSFSILSFSDIQILNSIGMTVLFGVIWLYAILYVAHYKQVRQYPI